MAKTSSKDLQIGTKLKLLRGNMTQAELARRSGVDKAIISKIESGKMSGTIECHRKLAEVFGLKLSELYAFLEDEKPEPAEFHPGNQKADLYQDFLQILTTIPLAKKILPTFITLKPGEEKSLPESNKQVERFIIILEGEADVEIDGKTYRMKKEPSYEKGDSIYSTSTQRYRIRNTGNANARLLIVTSPPVL
ncbi:MAG: helix-turn-helix domain-containing protein [Deltaproteobacteria bacterium]